ncbi:NXPE family member 4-like [Ylistrum balloti]|uniref:NXPE family member 4-like n=1 Tax=Ylistrum balloti TaxID=509963 RepID=UPI0029058973|nr:NXPE family member 4-like [Ylistrum balloti]
MIVLDNVHRVKTTNVAPDSADEQRWQDLSVLQRISAYKHETEIKDFTRLANSSFSKFYLQKKSKTYKIGETIKVDIALKDGLGRPVLSGGDVLRIWLKQPSTGNSVSGYVVDNGNGSHTGIVETLWFGKSELIVMIANTKKHVGIFLNYLQNNGIFYTIEAIFEDKNNTRQVEKTPCNVGIRFFGNASVCNFTKDNFGMSWYCKSPKMYNCSEWLFYTMDKSTNTLSKESDHLFRNYVFKKMKMNITIEADNKVKLPVLQNCMHISKMLTWRKTTPTGFYKNNTWKNLICKSTLQRTKEDYFKCLSGRRLLILGDSTNRIWFVYLVGYLGLKFTTGRWDEIKDKSWQRYAHATLKSRNMSIEWAPHELPFYGNHHSSRLNVRSVAFRLDEIPANSSDIVVLHWYLHIARVSHKIFREHVRNAKESVIRLLKRAPNIKIFIKGPHALTYVTNMLPYDFIRQIEQQILFDEFLDLQDRIIYLDQWDATVANENVHVHPNMSVNADMVHSMLSYICGRK